MASQTDIHNVGLYITRDPKHPSDRKLKVHAPGIGIIWCREDEDAEAIATRWIATLKGWPEHLVNAYNVNGSN